MLVETGRSPIPEVTAPEKSRALEIALADTTVHQLLEGKKYQIAPNGKIGVWHVGDTKLGVVFTIKFEQLYEMDFDQLLNTEDQVSHHFSGKAAALQVNVLLSENRVAKIAGILPE